MKKLLLFGAAVLLAAGCNSQSGTSLNTDGQQTAQNPAAQEQANNGPSQAANGNQPAMVTATAQNSTDASLNSDLGNIDGQMNNLNSDSASADQSLSEQQAPAAQ